MKTAIAALLAAFASQAAFAEPARVVKVNRGGMSSNSAPETSPAAEPPASSSGTVHGTTNTHGRARSGRSGRASKKSKISQIAGGGGGAKSGAAPRSSGLQDTGDASGNSPSAADGEEIFLDQTAVAAPAVGLGTGIKDKTGGASTVNTSGGGGGAVGGGEAVKKAAELVPSGVAPAPTNNNTSAF